MDSNKYILEFQKKKFEYFLAQNPEDFDIVFEIDGKKLYADKFNLCTVSPTFKSMLSERWSKPNEPIKIDTYSFDDFKEFLTFIYSGNCNLTNENIFAMTDMAEFYGIDEFKMACQKFLLDVQIDLKNVNQILELSDKYSMANLKQHVLNFITSIFTFYMKSEQFKNLQTLNLKYIIESNQNTLRPEELFENVFKWAENRALETQKQNNTLNLNEEIKKELTNILPFIKFENMCHEFLLKSVVTKSFLFSGQDLSNILLAARGKVYVTVFDENERVMRGTLNCFDLDNVIDAIESQKNVIRRGSSNQCFWATKRTKPSKLCKLAKKDGWFLVYDKDGDIAIKRHTTIVNVDDYLLANMFPEEGFQLSSKCQIQVHRYS